jgi:hypothetical protein
MPTERDAPYHRPRANPGTAEALDWPRLLAGLVSAFFLGIAAGVGIAQNFLR